MTQTRRMGRVLTPESRGAAAKPPPQLKPELIVLPERIAAGSVLLMPGVAVPSTLRVALTRVGEWDLVRGHNGYAVDRKLSQAGWHFFFMVPAVEASAIGFDAQKTFARALRRITGAVEADGFNAMEVTAVKRRRWLGLQYVSITAHPRHVRNSPFLHDPDPYHYPKGLWNFTEIFTVRNRRASQIKAM
ncbi:MAG TPA: hypothetical protein VFU86_08875 [Terriglobales bacterium]|nr:hypothetical protein [Terriglobales bacterium]